MIHIFHGFLGSPDDFSYLKRDDVIIHDLYSMESYPTIHPEDTLIGYSMGGRMALEIATQINFNLKKLVLINAHPGLEDEQQKSSRIEFEDIILQELKTRNKDEFLSFWNDLPVFFHDIPLKPMDEDRYQKSYQVFDRNRLSQQRNHLPEIITHKDKVLYIVGLFDEKYMDLASEIFIPHEVPVKGIPGGHRLFQQEKELKQILIDEGIL